MPGQRIPDLTAIAGASTANDDNLVIFDTDANTTKRILRSQLAAGLVGDLPYTPSGGISATTVPTAIAELDSEAAKSAALAANSGSSLVGFLQAGTSAVATTVQAKLRESRSVADYGASPSASAAVNAAAIQAALNAGGSIYFPVGIYEIDTPLSVTQLNTTLIGATKGMVGASTGLKYVGAATSSAMITVQNGRHGFYMDGFDMNANLLADICIYVIANAGSSTHHPALNNIMVRGYNTRGIVLGNNNTTVLNNGQMQVPQMNRIYWMGGALNAIGLLVNAQNAEFVVGNGWYFDIEPTAYSNHSNHIWAKSGGISVQGLLTTRANSYDVYSGGSQIIINGWRSEDELLFDTIGVQLEGPCVLSGVLARSGGASPTAQQIRFNGIDSQFTINGATLNGSIRIGSTNAKYLSLNGIQFTDPACVIAFNGPQNASGFIQNNTTGAVNMRGSDPQLLLEATDGTDLGGIRFGAQYTPNKTIAAFAANQPGLALPDGQLFTVSASLAVDIQGIVAQGGRNAIFYCGGANNVTFKHLSASATDPSYQLFSTTGADIVLAPGEALQMVYRSSNWLMWKLA